MAKTDTENIDALRTLLNALRGGQALLTVFEDAQAARAVLADQERRLTQLGAEDTAIRTRLKGLTADAQAFAETNTAARAEADRTIQVGLRTALDAAAKKIDAANAQAAAVERESAARIAEAHAKTTVAETALRETTARYDAVQQAYTALKEKLG